MVLSYMMACGEVETHPTCREKCVCVCVRICVDVLFGAAEYWGAAAQGSTARPIYPIPHLPVAYGAPPQEGRNLDPCQVSR